MFDPLSWALGFSLTKGTSWLLGQVFSRDLPGKLRSEVDRWVEKLPPKLTLAPDALFGEPSWDPDSQSHAALLNLRSVIEKGIIPSADDWQEAIEERRRAVRERFGFDAQAFFTAEPEDVIPEIRSLAGRITGILEEDQTLFQRQSMANQRKIIQLLEVLSSLAGASDGVGTVAKPEFQDEIGVAPQASSTPVFAGQPYVFTRYLLRMQEHDLLTGRRYRKITFRVRRNPNFPAARNVLVRVYLLVTRIFVQPDGTIGHGKHWIPLILTRTDNFIPRLSNYWSISHLIDPKVGQAESGFMRFIADPTVVDARVRVYLSGEVGNGKDYGEWEYDWTTAGTRLGTFRLRPLGQDDMTEELFDDVVGDQAEDGSTWPLLDAADLEKRIRDTTTMLQHLDDETV